MTRKHLQRIVQVLFVLVAGMQFNFTCTGVAEKVTHTINPCGTIFNCDPAEYDLLTTDFPNWNLDPTCTIPGQCGTVWPGGGGGDATTN
ncbi:MAG TPA: hypothetical protein PL151_12035 [Phycisphaerae bacterium]|nr:hypothetical protein [Phycisphaerae bacterium]HOJ72779.1 hypothetical protein [Phycisphaerae bacterium]HOM51794.1 hypothetical protein [Phycisphaerae bacterium]HOQ84372.1 hypothetical protein [Phycisphaerae bacterium]HPP26856.1 hypothetical protein [Phycisphaerae bacterium]